jgi:cysteinyl-tRNA synthetase
MDDDFNTAKGIGILFNLVKETNRILDEEGQSLQAKGTLVALTTDLKRIGGILGILQRPWQSFFEERASSQLQTMGFLPKRLTHSWLNAPPPVKKRLEASRRNQGPAGRSRNPPRG